MRRSSLTAQMSLVTLASFDMGVACFAVCFFFVAGLWYTKGQQKAKQKMMSLNMQSPAVSLHSFHLSLYLHLLLHCIVPILLDTVDGMMVKISFLTWYRGSGFCLVSAPVVDFLNDLGPQK